MSRTIGIVTSARADFGLLHRLMAAVAADPALRLRVYATGMHHSPKHGNTIEEVRSAGLGDALIEVPSWQDGDNPGDIANAMARGITAFAAEFTRSAPDILVIMGDRYDSYPAAVAAMPFTIPFAHLSGGELTEGQIDEAIRHSFTKLAHLHFPSTAEYGRRIRQLGEEPWRVTVAGLPGLDEMADFQPSPKNVIFSRLGLNPTKPVSLFTYHPETLSVDGCAAAIAEVLDAAHVIGEQVLFTAPNADTGNAPILAAIQDYCASHDNAVFRASLGRALYLEMLAHADCVVGNSSSGIVEAASFHLPVVNIGDRQRGRIAPANVIHAPIERAAILTAWKRALDPAFRASLAGLVNPYGDGHAIERIVAVLRSVPLDTRLWIKHFNDWPEPENRR